MHVKLHRGILAVSLALGTMPMAFAASLARHSLAPELELRTPHTNALGGGGLAPPTNENGRAVNHLGYVQAGFIDLEPDCTPDPAFPLGPDDRCVLLSAAPATTSYNFVDIGRVTLPARAAKTLICPVLAAQYNYLLSNLLAGPQTGLFRFRPSLTIEAAVLNDPSAIDPSSGLPYGGVLEFGGLGSSFVLSRTLAPGDNDQQVLSYSRNCAAGLSRQFLIDSGLSARLADRFFREPITIRLNLSGSARLAQFGSVTYGVRFFGD